MASTKAKREKFISSLIKWLEEKVMGFIDGVDIDWEFPGGLGADEGKGDPSVDGKNYERLVIEMRAALDKLGERQKKHY